MRYYSPGPLSHALPEAKAESIKTSPSRDWPLIWEWQVFADQPSLTCIMDWRLAGYRGGIALTGDWSQSEISEVAPWLAHEMPGINLLNQADTIQLMNWLAQSKPLNDQQWQTAARQLLRHQWRVLEHDQQALRRVDSPQPDQIQRLATQVQQTQSQWSNACAKVWPNVSEQLSTWQQALEDWQAQPNDPERRQHCQEAAEQHFAWLRSPSQHTVRQLAQAARQMQRHWQALLQQYQRLARQLQTANPPPAEQGLQKGLQNWFKRFDQDQLQTAEGIQTATIEWQTLMQQRSSAERVGQLSQSVHNTVDQHLYTVSQGLKQWQSPLQNWQASQTEPSVQKPAALHFSALAAVIQQLSAAEPEHSDISPLQTEQSPSQLSSSRKLILILEDNPVWAEELKNQTEQALKQFLNHFPEQRFRDWQIQIVDNLAAAETELKQALLLISDLSLPLQPGQLASRSHGVDFLTRHSASLKGLPVIVHSTPSWYLEDQQQISALGIQDLDFVFKSDPDAVQERVYSWLKTLRRRPLFWIQTDPLALNGVTLNLSPLNHSLMQILSTGQYLSPQQIVAELVEQGHQSYQAGSIALASESEAQSLPQDCQDWLASLAKHWRGVARNRLLILQTQANLLPADTPAAQRWDKLQQSLVYSHFGFAREIQSGEWDFLPQAQGFKWPELIESLFQHHATIASQPQAETIAAEWRQRVSKWISGLKRALKAEFQAVHQHLDTEQLICTYEPDAQDYLTGLSPQQQGQHLYQLQARQHISRHSTAGPWRVLLVENNASMAQTLSEALEQVSRLQQVQLEITPVTNLEAGLACLQSADWGVDLILLDLQIPLTAAEYAQDPDSGHPQGGYRLLKAIRQSLAQSHPQQPYRVLVTSHFADDDFSRQSGIELGIPIRNYLPKGRGFQGLSWNDSLHLRLDRLLRELKTQQLQPDQKQLSLRQHSLPISVRVIACSNSQLKLQISSPESKTVDTILRQKRAQLMRALLQAWPQPLTWQAACQRLDCNDAQLKNHRNRLRKVDIAKWPLDWLSQYTQEASGNVVLCQQSQAAQSSLRLNISEVLDPEGLLDQADL